MRHELRGGKLPAPTRERIALAVAERRGDPYSLAQHAKTARAAGLGLDEITQARSFQSADRREAALLAFLEGVLSTDGRPATHLVEEAREVGWDDEELLEAVGKAGRRRDEMPGARHDHPLGLQCNGEGVANPLQCLRMIA